jgi:monoamine oxidase
MAAVHLFHSLQRTLETAWCEAFLEARGADSARINSLPRRAFLRGALGLAAGLTVPLLGANPSRAQGTHPTHLQLNDGQMPAASDKNVVIVGAGLAGLHCAYRLLQGGVRAKVYDAGHRIGGRLLTLRNHFQSGPAELGGSFIDSTHYLMLELAKEFDLEVDCISDRPAGLLSDAIYFFNGGQVKESEIVEQFKPVAKKIVEAKKSEQDNLLKQADKMSIIEWLQKNDASPLISNILNIVYTGACGVEADKQSALNLLHMINPRDLPFRIIGEADQRYRLRDGNDTLPTVLADKLKDQIELGSFLVAVSKKSDERLVATFDQKGGKTLEVTADHLVLAIPFTLLRQVQLDANLDFTPEKRTAINELGYGTNAKLLVGGIAPAWKGGWVFTDNTLPIIWDDRPLTEKGSYRVLTRYLGGQAGVEIGKGSVQDHAQMTLRLLEHIKTGTTGKLDPTSAVRQHWPTEPLFQGSYSCYLPGQGQWGEQHVAGKQEGNVHFCGEHTSSDFSGYMEGAAQTGALAAAAVLDGLGVQTPPALQRVRAIISRCLQYPNPCSDDGS